MKSGKRILKSFELAIRKITLFGLKLAGGNRAAKLSTSPLQLPPDPKILFLRQDRIGDAIITTPLLLAVKARYPKADITMLLGKNNQAIIPLLPIDCKTVIYEKSWVKDRKMLGQLRKQQFDVVIDLTDNASVTSSLLISRISAKYAIGIEKENAVVYDVLVPRLDRSDHHISERIAQLLMPLGINPKDINLKPTLIVARQSVMPGRLGINISAGTESRWAPERTYSEIAKDALTSGHWSEVIIFCEVRDAEKAAKIVKLSQDPRIKAQPSTKSYAEFASALSSCEALITPDTSVVHLAAALDIPQVVIYAPIPPGLMYWTPVGVPYEMMVQSPTLAALEPQSVTALLRKLETKLVNAKFEASPTPAL